MYRITPRRGGGTPSGCNHQPMSNTYFAFKQFTIFHDKCAMKVGTDGVLLGAWANVTNANRILDIGTGTGLIAIMLAQRSEAIIDAVEIDEQACIQARANVAACPWYQRITIHHDAFQHFAGITQVRYDLIISNPPYFRNSLKPPAKSRSLARHDDNLGIESLFLHVSAILAPDGMLALIFPAGVLNQVADTAGFHGFFLSKLLRVRPATDREYTRCLVVFNRTRDGVADSGELSIRDMDNGFTKEYKQLTKDYYLNF
jgi:tRNA1Val (adenine37-N6)-methyltransferase